ncbi:MAG: hypothetical protein ACRD45_15785 [Bryobacteraceae bacterium]
MRIFLDNSIPAGLRRYLSHHQVVTAANQRWEELENGELLRLVEGAGFDVMITADQDLEYQQNLRNRKIALVVLGSNRWAYMQKCVPEIVAAVDAARASSYAFIEVPLPPKPAPQR